MNEELKVIISAEVSKLKQGLKEGQNAIEGLQKKAGVSSEDIDKKFQKMGQGIKKGLEVGAKAIAGVSTALVATAGATEEYRTNQAKLSTAFESAGASADTAKNVYNDLYRVLGDDSDATEAANHLSQLTTNQQELSQWTNICEGVYATFGKSLPIEGLTEAANETAKVGKVTGTLADALNWAGVNEDAFNAQLAACNSEAEREQLIRETLNGLYSEAASGYEENAAGVIAQNEAQNQLNENLARVGEIMAPLLNLVINFGAQLLEVLAPVLTVVAQEILPPLQAALSVIAEKLQVAFEWAQQHQILMGLIIGVITGLVAAIQIYNAIQAIKIAMDAAETASLGALITAKLAAAAATLVAMAPYLLIAAVIGLVIAAIVLCIKHWDDIKAKVGEAAEFIKEKVIGMKDKVVEKFEELRAKVQAKVENLKEKLGMIWDWIKAHTIDKVIALKDNVVEKFENLKENVSSRVENLRNAIGEKFNSLREKITSPIEWARDKVKGLIEKIKGYFKFAWSLPKLKLPHLQIKGKFSLAPPSVPKFSIDWYQHGGVFDSPTLFNYGSGALGGLGENGAEAVVPLEKNTQWLDRIAERLNSNSSSAPIVLEVDGKVFAQTSIDSINGLTKQTGKLGLRLI